MEDETLGFFKKTSSSHARLNVPALVQVAALAIIMIRGLDVLMIFNTLGVRGIGEFIHRSVQTWSLTLVFLSSLVLVFIEIWCHKSPPQVTCGRLRWGTVIRSCSAFPVNQNVKSSIA